MWTKDVTISGCIGLDSAIVWVNSLNLSGYAGYNDWRLPLVLTSDAEIVYLLTVELGNSDPFWTPPYILFQGPFINLEYRRDDPDPDRIFSQKYFWYGNYDYFDSDGLHWGLLTDNVNLGLGWGEGSLNQYQNGRYAWLVRDVTQQVNTPPVANAENNLDIKSYEVFTTTINGTATDPDADDVLTYKWLEGSTVLLDSTPVGSNGDCPLSLALLPLSIGTHTLILEVSDGTTTASDEMILSIGNSEPNVAPSGEGIYDIGSTVTLSGDVSDFDGDLLTFTWLEGSTVLGVGTVTTVIGGDVVNLPDRSFAGLGLGDHAISLKVTDGINTVVKPITVTIKDDSKPCISPVADSLILWPPNHKMVNISIDANASDNSGLPVELTAIVSSNEPVSSSEDGDLSPDWTLPVVNQVTGEITLQLRAERSGTGNGRDYSISITATDTSGNSSVAVVTILVPHDQSK